MEALTGIINELTNVSIPLSQPLLKTKVLASRINNNELERWVSKELSGYDNDQKLPAYRVCLGHLKGNYVSAHHQHTNVVLPTFGEHELLATFNFIESIESLNKMAETQDGHVGQEYNAHELATYERLVHVSGSPHIRMLSAMRTVSINAVHEIVAAVRQELLNMLLKVETAIGGAADLEAVKEKNPLVTQLVMNITGDGNIVNTGNHVDIKASISIQKGSTGDLEKVLRSNKVEDVDIAEIVEIVQEDEPQSDTHFGAKVNKWISKMVGKALDGSWQIGAGAAGSLLADAIKAFYGMP